MSAYAMPMFDAAQRHGSEAAHASHTDQPQSSHSDQPESSPSGHWQAAHDDVVMTTNLPRLRATLCSQRDANGVHTFHVSFN